MSALKIDVCEMKRQKGVSEGVIVSCLGCIRAVTLTTNFAVAACPTPLSNHKRFLTTVEIKARGKSVSLFVLKNRLGASLSAESSQSDYYLMAVTSMRTNRSKASREEKRYQCVLFLVASLFDAASVERQ
ncbi:hypothetical protein ACJ73_07670 [Blastomyces percursus]|uniref:Uncharacterized protein n=1 Tax=Blastomyces percursus TaxID=1658174 RepID=A0A1J9PXB6_9EURO|nr:hypothetical protein ACJ73_07670 [Blastomyces percursus]